MSRHHATGSRGASENTSPLMKGATEPGAAGRAPGFGLPPAHAPPPSLPPTPAQTGGHAEGAQAEEGTPSPELARHSSPVGSACASKEGSFHDGRQTAGTGLVAEASPFSMPNKLPSYVDHLDSYPHELSETSGRSGPSSPGGAPPRFSGIPLEHSHSESNQSGDIPGPYSVVRRAKGVSSSASLVNLGSLLSSDDENELEGHPWQAPWQAS